MTWIWLTLGLLAALLLVLLVVLALPVRVAFRAEAAAGLRGRIEATLLDGRGPAFVLVDSARRRKPEGAAPRKARRRRSRRRTGRKVPPGAVLRLVQAVLVRIQFRRLRVSGVFGLPDPAETGALYGLIAPLQWGLPGGRITIDVTPDFRGSALDGQAEGVLSVRPLSLVPPGLRFAWRMVRGAE